MDPYAGRLDELKERLGRGLASEVPEVVIKDRWDRCRALMKQQGLDVLVIYSNEQPLMGREWARYFANVFLPLFNCEALIVIPLEGEPAFLVNYEFMVEFAQQMSPIKDIRAPMERFGSGNRYAGLSKALQDVLAERGLSQGKIGFVWEGMQGDFSLWAFRQVIKKTFSAKRIQDASQLPFNVIMEKTEYDRAMIRRAAEISSEAVKEAFGALREGGKEYEAYLAYQRSAIESGCDAPISHCLIQSGVTARVALKPFYASGRKLKHGDMIIMDAGLCYQGYYNDIARTAIIGPPNKEQRRMYDAALTIADRMASALRPGVKVCDVAKVIRDGMKEFGYTKTHVLLGHGTGAMLNEPPYFMEWNETPLKENWTVNLEPALHMDDPIGGCRIEDTYVVTPNGGERLTTANRELVEV